MSDWCTVFFCQFLSLLNVGCGLSCDDFVVWGWGQGGYVSIPGAVSCEESRFVAESE